MFSATPRFSQTDSTLISTFRELSMSTSRREEVAQIAMLGLLQGRDIDSENPAQFYAWIAMHAVRQADALMAELDKSCTN